MTQPLEAVGGSDDTTVIAAEPTLEDRFAAFGNDEDEDEEPAEPRQPEDAAEPDASLLEAEAAEAVEAEDAKPIAPPVSLTAEEKDAFKTWPREAQEAISRRVGELEKGLHSKAQEASKARQAVEQQAVEVIQQLNAQRVQQLEALLPGIPDEPSAHLQIQDPVAYADRIEARRWAINQHNQAMHAIEAIQQQSRQMDQYALDTQQRETEAALREQFPEYLDNVKGAELRTKLGSTALAMGYSPDQLNDVTAQDILAMRLASEWKAKADKFDTLMSKQMANVRGAKDLPKISRPGASQGKGAAQQQRYQSDRQAMQRGDNDAAKRVFSQFL